METVRPREVLSTTCGLVTLTFYTFRLTRDTICLHPAELRMSILGIILAGCVLGILLIVTKRATIGMNAFSLMFVLTMMVPFREAANAASILAPTLTLNATAYLLSWSGLGMQRAVLFHVLLSFICALGWMFISSGVVLLFGAACALSFALLEVTDPVTWKSERL